MQALLDQAVVDLQAALGQRVAITAQALMGGAMVRMAGDEADASMPQADQITGHVARAAERSSVLTSSPFTLG